MSMLDPRPLMKLIKKPSWYQRLIRSRSVSWPNASEVAAWGNNIPLSHDDGSHYDTSPFYFEWWYFDMLLDNDSSIAVILHMTDLINPYSRYGSVNVALFKNKSNPYYLFKRYETKRILHSKNGFDIQMGMNHCWSNGKDYVLHIEDDGLKIDLNYESETHGWRPGNGTVVFDNNRAVFCWIVPQPRAKVSGTIQREGIKETINGVGYHDHNWGTVSLLYTIREWSWGRLYLDKYTIVFADIVLTAEYGGVRMMPFCIMDNTTILVSSFLTENRTIDEKRDFLRYPNSADNPIGWNLEWKEEGVELHLVAEASNVLEKADLLTGNLIRRKIIEKMIAHPYYLRCSVEAKGQLIMNEQMIPLEGKGIYEQMTFGR